MELILPFGFDEHEFIKDLEDCFEFEMEYVGAVTVEIVEIHQQVFFDEDALEDEN